MIFIAAAACLLFGLVAGFLLMAETPQTAAWSVLRTEPGNLAEQILPDGTRVILNGNSRLQYAASIAHQRHREVILSGEAFFEVRHLPEHARFSVLTENARITVLGTDFNVCARGQRTAVSLLNGRVELGSLEGTEKQVLVPGNTAEISGGGVIVREDNVESRASWRKHIWVFNNTPLKEIVTRLEESYGIQVTIDTHVDLDRTISGTLSTKNLATLYKALEGMFDIRIVPSEQHILIRK